MNKKIIIMVLAFFVIVTMATFVEADSLGVTHTYNSALQKYEIYQWFGLEKVADVHLLSNTERCLTNCEATIKVEPYITFGTNENPNDYDWTFLDIISNEQEIEYSIWNLFNWTEIIEIPEYDCEFIEVTTVNGTELVENCTLEGYIYEEIEKTEFQEIDFYGFEFESGREYILKLQGKKPINYAIEWIPTFYSVELDEWAWWNASVSYKRKLYFNTTSSSLIKIPQIINGSIYGLDGDIIWTLPQDTFVSSTNYSEYLYYNDFSDFYVINASENQELSFEVENGSANSYNPTEVWESSLMGVWHLGEGTGALTNDSTSNNNNGTLVNNADWVQGKFGYGLTFDGADDWVDVKDDASLDITDEITMMAWINPDTIPAYPGLPVFAKRANKYAIWIFGGDELRVVFDGIGEHNTTGAGLQTGVWQFVAATYDGSDVKIYLNGSEVYTHSQSGSIGTSGDNFEIGTYAEAYDYDGKIDEIRIYNKSLGADEITAMWYQGLEQRSFLGSEQTNIDITTTLISPDDNTNTTTATHNFTCNATAIGLVLNNITVYVFNSTGNTILEEVKTASGTYAEAGHEYALPYNDDFLWNCLSQDTTGTYTDWDTNRSIYFNALEIILVNPDNATNFTVTSIFFNASKTEGDSPALDNATIYIYDSTSLFYSNTNDTGINSSSWTVPSFVPGEYTWGVKAYTIDNQGTSENRTLYVRANITSVVYNTTIYETETTTMTINFTAVDGITPTTRIIWGGTIYIPTSSNIGKNYSVYHSIEVPLGSGTNDFYWNITQTDYSIYSTNYTQTIEGISLAFCNATLNVTTVNFTTMDEITNNLVNTTFGSTWFYSLGTTQKNYSFEDAVEDNYSYQFCIYPNRTFYVDMDTEIDAAGYSPRTWYFRDAQLTNTTQHLIIYLLNDSDAVKFYFTVTQNLAPLTDATVTITKYDVGTGSWVTIGIRGTDDAGQFIEYLELDKTYRFSIVHTGNLLGVIEKVAICTAAPCEIQLEIGVDVEDFWDTYDSYFAANVSYNLSFDPDTKMVDFTFVDLAGTANYFRLQVDRIDFNQSFPICNETSYAVAGTLECNLTDYDGQFFAQTFVSRSPELFLASIYAFIDELLETIGIEEGLFFAFLIVIIVGLVGAWNPAFGIILALVAFFLSVVLGFVAVSYTTVILMVILAVVIIIKMGGTKV